MSKSYDNAIFLSDNEKEVAKKVKQMLTDPARARRDDPGDPEGCNLYPFHKIYSPKSMQDEVAEGCRTAKIGCGDCKNMLTQTMLEGMRPIMEKRCEIIKKPKEVEAIIAAGTKKAQVVATSTLEKVKQVMKFK